MYKELATIKRNKEVTGFVVYDGYETMVMDIEDAKREAAAGNMDTLGYEDGRFVPILQGKLSEDIKKLSASVFRRVKRNTTKITFDEFVANDCIFREEDVERMLEDPAIVLANVCLVFENLTFDGLSPMLTMAFYTVHREADNKLKDTLAPYNMSSAGIQQKDCFTILNLPLSDPASGFDLLAFQQASGLKFLCNLGILDNMADRIDFMAMNWSWPARKLIRLMKPTEYTLESVASVLRTLNRITLSEDARQE